MAILKTVSGEQVEVADGELLMDAAESLGVSFGCRAGVCTACKVRIISGSENLENKTENEDDLDLEDNERCMCQAKIKSGEVIIDF